MADTPYGAPLKDRIAITLGNYIWGGLTELDNHDPGQPPQASTEICLATFPNHLVNIHSPCLRMLLAKLLGMAIIVGACLNKAPILRNVWVQGSVAGLSLNSLYGEVLMYSNSALYGILQGTPFTAYGENIAVSVQCMILVVLVWHYSKVPTSSMVAASVSFACYCITALFFMSPEYYYVLVMANWPALLFSRGSQILQSFNDKHTGAQSLVTHGMNLIGSLIRVMTTFQEVGFDVPLLSGFIISILLNTILVAQVVMYQENTKKVLQKESSARKKKE